MSYDSPLKLFRDMSKNPDFYPEDPVERAEIKKMLLEDERQTQSKKSLKITKEEKEEKRPETITSAGAAFKKTIELINSDGLLPEFCENKTEAGIIAQRRAASLNFLNNILEDIKNYLTQVNKLQLQKVTDYDDVEKYQDIIGSSDMLRRSYHNKLINNLKIAMRLININFNADYPEEARLKEEAKMPERRGMSTDRLRALMRQRQYYKFPYATGVFINFGKAPKDPTGEREYIASWAADIYTDLAALSETLINKDNKKTPV